MRVSVERAGELGRRMTVAVPAEEVEKEVSTRLRRLLKTVRLPGFRPGKAPLKIVEAKYGAQVLQEVAGQMIENSLREALREEGLQPVVGPEIEPKAVSRGVDLEYVATFEVFPEFKKLDLEGLKIERPVCVVTDEDLDRTIESMRRQRVTWRPVERPAGKGDRVRIDFRGSAGGEAFPGNEAKDYPVVLGESNVLEEFETGLESVSPGTTKTISVEFPPDYHGKEVAGKRADFEVDVLEVAEAVLPDVDAEFAKSFGVADGSVEAMRKSITENLTREVDDRISRVLKERVLQALFEANQIDLPQKLVEEEVQRMLNADKSIRARQGIEADDAPDLELYQSEARRRVALGLIVYEVIHNTKLQLDKARVREKIEKMAGSYEDPQAFIQWYYGDQKRLGQVESLVLEEQVIETLLQTAAIEDQPVGFKELMYGRERSDIL